MSLRRFTFLSAAALATAADWGMLDRNNPVWKPKRDTLGDTTLTLSVTPGHTPGTISTLIQVKDGGRSHLVAEWGGTLYNFARTPGNFKTYIPSAERFRDIVAKTGPDVAISNHTIYDGSKTKLPALAKRKAGNPHPDVIGNVAVQHYLTVVAECAKAAQTALDR
jgi:metallo-beta-lactamase class B